MVFLRFFMILAVISFGACHQSEPPLSGVTLSGERIALDEFAPVSGEVHAFDGVADISDIGAYRLGVNDTLEIAVYKEDDLSGSYKIASNGVVSMPLIGGVKAAGLTASELERLIAKRYADGYLVAPSVTVQIAHYRPFYIMGEVRAPGQYAYSDPMTVLNAVAMAGGFTYRAQQEAIRLRKENQGDYMTVSPHHAVMPGDVIVVRERLF